MGEPLKRRQVLAHPGQVTIYAAGPLANIALAVAIDVSRTRMIKTKTGKEEIRRETAEQSFHHVKT